MECGSVNGLKTIAVCTGRFQKEHFMESEHKPDAIFENLTNVKEFLELINQW